MLRQCICVFAAALAALLTASSPVEPVAAEPSGDSGKVIVAYVFPQNGPLQAGQIDPQRLTRINYAFALVQNGRMVLPLESDKANVAFLTSLKKQNPSLTVLLSVGG